MLRVLSFVFFAATAAAAEPVKLATVSSEPPKEWVSEKPKYTLRSHQFRLKSEKDGVADAELIVSQQMKPDPDKVFPGYKQQFELPDGKTIDDISKISKFEVNGVTVHLLDVTGTWK
jgi:hypothetical protein